jgi:penicillin-binding protein 2
VVLAAVLAVLAARLITVQIMDSRAYLRAASLNAAQSMPLVAPRGIIYDRYGKVLVANKAVFSVYVLQTHIKDRAQLINMLSSLLSVPRAEIDTKLSEKRARPFDPILIRQNVPKDVVSRIEEKKHLLDGVVVNIRPVRIYPNGRLAAHVLGYIGEVTSEDIERFPAINLRRGDLIGKTGIERVYDAYLRGINGGERLSISSYGRASSEKGVQDPVPGKNIRLSLDLELQRSVEEALESSNGSVVVLDVSNGDVLAMASHPGYDPNMFSAPISAQQWKKMYSGSNPFMNRAINSYPPGSIFKTVSISAVLENKLFKSAEKFFCPGFFKQGARVAKCWKPEGHGDLDLYEGLVQSCNVVFYQVGLKAGPDVLADFAGKYGLGHLTGIDLPSESAGIVPSSSWKKKVYKENWYPGDSLNYGIGQGFLWVTPLQMTNMYASIGNGGERFETHLMLDIRDRDGTQLFTYKPKVIGSVPVSKENLEVIRSALHDVVSRGTGIAAKVPSFEAAGKTGTAENPRKPAHAWFMCYAPFDDPKIAVGAFVEHGQHGNRVTAQIAHKVLDWYYKNRVMPPPSTSEAESAA